MGLNWVLSILVHKGILTLEEAEALAKKLVLSIHSQNFADAHKLVESVLHEVESKAPNVDEMLDKLKSSRRKAL